MTWPCDVCGREFASPHQRSGHGRAHPPASPEQKAERARLATQRYAVAHPERREASLVRYKATHPHAARDYLRKHPEKAREFRARSYPLLVERGRTAEYRNRDRDSGAGKARRSVARALKSGRLVKDSCQVCGEVRVEAHHYLGYAREHRRDVWWLCKRHHEAAHHEGLEVAS